MIACRTDCNSQIGMGHIMRCLAIADAAKRIGEDSIFIVSSDDCKEIILSRGYEVIVLNLDYTNMEPEDILPALDLYLPRVAFVDSYYVTPEYMEAIHITCRSMGCKLVYIDDRCFFPYRCDVLLNYNVFGRREDYTKLYSGRILPTFLLGTTYTPLRNEFQDIPMRSIASEIKNVLISTGGADTEHFTKDIVEEAALHTNYTFHFVVGMLNPEMLVDITKIEMAHLI